MTDNAPRQPKGVPVGGQFAATAHSEPDITLSTGSGSRPTGLPQRPARPAGLPPQPPRSGDSGGSGGLPPTGGSTPAGAGEDDERRKETEKFVAEALHPLRAELVRSEAATLRFGARENGTLHVNEITRDNGYPVADAEGLSDRLTSAINSQVKGGGGIPAAHFLGDKKSVYVDAVTLINEKEIKHVRPGIPPVR